MISGNDIIAAIESTVRAIVFPSSETAVDGDRFASVGQVVNGEVACTDRMFSVTLNGVPEPANNTIPSDQMSLSLLLNTHYAPGDPDSVRARIVRDGERIVGALAKVQSEHASDIVTFAYEKAGPPQINQESVTAAWILTVTYRCDIEV